jgi:hypothetical protein
MAIAPSNLPSDLIDKNDHLCDALHEVSSDDWKCMVWEISSTSRHLGERLGLIIGRLQESTVVRPAGGSSGFGTRSISTFVFPGIPQELYLFLAMQSHLHASERLQSSLPILVKPIGTYIFLFGYGWSRNTCDIAFRTDEPRDPVHGLLRAESSPAACT